MSLTVGKLREALAGAPDDAAVMVICEGVLRHAVTAAAAPNGFVAVVRGQGQDRLDKRFSEAEKGLVGGLAAAGMSDEAIADLLDRSPHSVRKHRGPKRG